MLSEKPIPSPMGAHFPISHVERQYHARIKIYILNLAYGRKIMNVIPDRNGAPPGMDIPGIFLTEAAPKGLPGF